MLAAIMAGNLEIMADLLLELERELRVLNLWSEDRPANERLQSGAPFAADQLEFELWLQWIFIPQIKIIIESNSSLPASCNISSYAQECMKNTDPAPKQLLKIILQVDEFITSA